MSMKIGIDISQIIYEGTGVSNFTRELVEHMVALDTKNEYVLFGSSLRRRFRLEEFKEKFSIYSHVKVKIYPLPPSFLDILWNRLHIVPIEVFTGTLDVFISSDWTQPPTISARKVTIIYDMIVYKHPKETAEQINKVQKRRYKWVKKEIDEAICISKATKKDAMELLHLPEYKLKVVYPGF